MPNWVEGAVVTAAFSLIIALAIIFLLILAGGCANVPPPSCHHIFLDGMTGAQVSLIVGQETPWKYEIEDDGSETWTFAMSCGHTLVLKLYDYKVVSWKAERKKP